MIHQGILFYFLAVLTNAGIGCGDNYDPHDCKPKRKFEIPGTTPISYEFQAYTKEDPLTLHILFQNLDIYSYSDRIVLSNESTVYQSRDGRLKSNPFNVTLPMDGWQDFDISVNGSSIHINKFTKVLDYPIELVTVMGRYLTLCSDGTPMWQINDTQEILIPIHDSKTIVAQLKLFSLTEFEPYIDTTEDIDFQSNKKVKRSIYNPLIMSKNEDYLLIILEDKMFLKNKDGDNVMSKHLMKRPSELSVSSLKGEFHITLLLNHPYQELQAAETQIEAIASCSHESQNTPSTGFIIMAVTTTLSLIICIAAIITIIRTKSCSERRHVNDVGHNKLDNGEKHVSYQQI